MNAVVSLSELLLDLPQQACGLGFRFTDNDGARRPGGIHRQPEFRKANEANNSRAPLKKPSLTKEQEESIAVLEKRSPKDPLTLIKK
jgi:hypothetical protein